MIEAFLRAKSTFPALAQGLDPDFQAMCVRARVETLASKREPVERAMAAIRQRYHLPPEPRSLVAAESWARRRDAVKRALHGLVVHGDAYDIQNVFDATLVAGALWNYKRATGHQEGLALLASRVGGFLARRRDSQSKR